MTDGADDWRALNRANWDERTALHLGPEGYDLSSHRAGAGRLDAIAEAELGPVAGLRVLHLQCHIGSDTVALAQRGTAEVVGVDLSPAAMAAARTLAAEVGAGNARFVEADVYAVPEVLPDQAGSFDLVVTTWGTIYRLPDLAGWARVVAYALRPGGALYFADDHPVIQVFGDAADPGDPDGRPGWDTPYFAGGPLLLDGPYTYAGPRTPLVNRRTVEWTHTLGGILDALRGAGLALAWLHEHPRLTWRRFPVLVQDDDGLWTWPGRPWLPLALSLRAVRVGPPR